MTERFERALEKLTKDEKRNIRKSLLLLMDNPHHPGLHVKKMGGTGNIWEVRSSKTIRMTFEMKGSFIILRNVGEHGSVLKNP